MCKILFKLPNVLKKTFVEGLLTKKQYEEFSDTFSIRNMIAHGIRAEVKNAPALRRAIVACLDVLGAESQ